MVQEGRIVHEGDLLLVPLDLLEVLVIEVLDLLDIGPIIREKLFVSLVEFEGVEVLLKGLEEG